MLIIGDVENCGMTQLPEGLRRRLGKKLVLLENEAVLASAKLGP